MKSWPIALAIIIITLCGAVGAESAIVPQVVGMAEPGATAAVTAAGLVAAVVYEVGEVGMVLAQSPIGGSTVGDGSTVTIIVGRDTTPDEDGENLYRVVLNHVLSMFGFGVVAGMFIKLTNRS